nr:hypothetical protein [Mesorhizobium amorphae]
MYEVWEATSGSKHIALARKALEVSPLCADAYVLLAEEEAGSVEEVLDYYQKGVAAGASQGERAVEFSDCSASWPKSQLRSD